MYESASTANTPVSHGNHKILFCNPLSAKQQLKAEIKKRIEKYHK